MPSVSARIPEATAAFSSTSGYQGSFYCVYASYRTAFPTVPQLVNPLITATLPLHRFIMFYQHIETTPDKYQLKCSIVEILEFSTA
jgi:hypothetical protein